MPQGRAGFDGTENEIRCRVRGPSDFEEFRAMRTGKIKPCVFPQLTGRFEAGRCWRIRSGRFYGHAPVVQGEPQYLLRLAAGSGAGSAIPCGGRRYASVLLRRYFGSTHIGEDHAIWPLACFTLM